MQEGTVHKLNLSYSDYIKWGQSIANTRIDKYIVYDELGRGAFGAVYKGMHDQTKIKAAIKVLDLNAIQKQPNERVREIKRRLCQTESQLMMLCNSNNVVKCYDVYENAHLKIIVMEYCNGGELQKEIRNRGRIPEKDAIMILKQIINGIAQELHTHNIIHRDLKAENILSHNGVYKICDMGFSKQVTEEEIKHTTLGTITTMAPEVMQKQPYGLKADIWSIGVIFFQMVFGKFPYTSTNATLMYHQIQTKKILHTEAFEYNGYKASKQVTRFLKQILTIDKHKRLGWKELISHPIFQDKHEAERLSAEFRINIPINVPKIQLNDQVENECMNNEKQNFPQKNTEPLTQRTHQMIRITKVEAGQRMKEAVNNQDQIYQWVKENYLQCLKTELIFNEIFLLIEANNLLDFKQRANVEFTYLILTRCLNNISVINERVKHEKQAVSILLKLQQVVTSLYGRIMIAWNKWAKILTDRENQFKSIVTDRFMKIFKLKSLEEKDRFLIDIEKTGYSKEEQINFTDQQYIKPYVLKALNSQPERASKKVRKYLSHYSRINFIKLGDLDKQTFKEYVEMILQK